jgi:23S rRNA (uracil747-C5)-methyltransferase
MRCHYYDAGRCRSCTDLTTPYPEQVTAKERAVRELLPDVGTWLPTVTGPEAGFRNKAKLVVGGTVAEPTLGILGPDRAGVDLRTCPLYSARMHALLPTLAELITRAGLTPYEVRARRGELKHLLVTESPDGEFLVRVVLRSTEGVPRLRKHLPWLLAAAPAIAVLTVNLLPGHQALLEGEHEEVLTERATLPLRLDAVTLQLGPRSFFQTNTTLARALYRQAAAWVDEVAPASVWDLYCGVGGFAHHLAAPGRRVVGVETSAEAVAAARLAGDGASFEAGDAAAWAAASDEVPDLVVVNPPRRGLGDLAGWLGSSGVRHVVYSSCNAASLARDLAAMPSLRPSRAVLVDLFPHTRHHEVLTLLERR